MSKRQKEVTIYKRGGGRLYGDFRPCGGDLKALKPTGETRATTDYGIAQVVVGEHLKKLAPFVPALLPIASIVAVIVCLTLLIGLLAGRDVFRETPIPALRDV